MSSKFLVKKAEEEKVKILFLTRDGLFKKTSGRNNYRKEIRELVELIVLQDYRDVIPGVVAVYGMLKDELIEIIVKVLKHVLYSKQSQLIAS